MFIPHRARWSCHAGLRPAPQFARRHHPDFDKMATQGWRALEAEGKLPALAWFRREATARTAATPNQAYPGTATASAAQAATASASPPAVQIVRDSVT